MNPLKNAKHNLEADSLSSMLTARKADLQSGGWCLLLKHNWWMLRKEYLSSNNASIVKQFHPMHERFQTLVQHSIWYWSFIILFHVKKTYILNLTALHIRNSFCMTNVASLLSYQHTAKPYCLSNSRPQIFSNDFLNGQCGKARTTTCSDFNKSHNCKNIYLISN